MKNIPVTKQVCVHTDKVLRIAKDAGCSVESGGRHMKIYDPGHHNHVAFPNGKEQSIGVASQIFRFFKAIGIAAIIVMIIVAIGQVA
jgi:hypothetical protein